MWHPVAIRIPLAGAAVALCLAAAPLGGDAIVLKSGRRILAEAVREEGTRVIYETENGRYSLHRSLVERIEKGSAPTFSAGDARPDGSAARAMPVPPVPPPPIAEKAPLLASGEVDREQLEAMIRAEAARPDDSVRRKIGSIFLAAIDYEMRRGRADAAVALARRGVSALPQDPQLMLAYGVLLLHKQQAQAAREWLNLAGLAAPDSPQVWKFLGLAEYQSDRTEHAIRAWRKSLALASDPEVQRMLDRALRETSAEVNFQQASSNHFTLRFEGRQVAPSFRGEILEVLERHYLEIDRHLDARLREPISVILYTDQAYRDVTRAPAWAGALNDGRIRIPVNGLSSVSPDLSRVLKHELAHSFVWAKTRGRCPTWLNEGLAQMMEGGSIRHDSRFAQFWKVGRRLPWTSLQESFLRLDPRIVPFAYAQSQAAVELLVGRFGMLDMVRLLARLAEGQFIEPAFQSVYRMSYRDLDEALAAWLGGGPGP